MKESLLKSHCNLVIPFWLDPVVTVLLFLKSYVKVIVLHKGLTFTSHIGEPEWNKPLSFIKTAHAVGLRAQTRTTTTDRQLVIPFWLDPVVAD